MSKAPRIKGRAANRPVQIPRAERLNKQLQIPRSVLYGNGTLSTAYDLKQMLMEYGLRNMQWMLEIAHLANGGDKAADQTLFDTLKVWELKRHGNKFDMLSEALGLNAYGTSKAVSRKQGIRS